MNLTCALVVLLTSLMAISTSLKGDDQGPVCGIGIVATYYKAPGAASTDTTVPEYLIVRDLIPGGSAGPAGILRGDEIFQVDGRAVAGMQFKDACALLRGAEGTQVTVTVQRNGHQFVFTLTREPLHVQK